MAQVCTQSHSFEVSSTSRKPTRYVFRSHYLELEGPDFLQILDELIIAGELQESSKKSVLRVVRVPLHITLSPLTPDVGHTIRQRRGAREQRGHARAARECRFVVTRPPP